MADDWTHGLDDGWTNFTPTITGPGFEIWNGTLLGAYNRDMTEMRIRLERGSQTKGTPERLTLPDGFGALPPVRRDELAALLDEADVLLAEDPKLGDRLDLVQTRQVQAQHLLLKAQLAILRRQR